MELKTISADELRMLAERFRERAAECAEDYYRELILRTARELEDHADMLDANGDTALVIAEEDMLQVGLN